MSSYFTVNSSVQKKNVDNLKALCILFVVPIPVPSTVEKISVVRRCRGKSPQSLRVNMQAIMKAVILSIPCNTFMIVSHFTMLY